MIIALSSCGGSSATKSVAFEDGRVRLRNETNGRYEVQVFESETDNPVMTEVKANETKDVSHTIKGGTKITVRIRGYSGGGATVKEIPITINGNVTIRITSIAIEGPFTYEITGG